ATADTETQRHGELSDLRLKNLCVSVANHPLATARGTVLLFALGDDFVERVLEEDSFQAVARVSRWSLARERLRLVGVVAFVQYAQRHVVEKSARGVEREVDGVVCEGADLEAESGGVPGGGEARGDGGDGAVGVNRAVEQAAGRGDAPPLGASLGA